jgi:hypothetical protein
MVTACHWGLFIIDIERCASSNLGSAPRKSFRRRWLHRMTHLSGATEALCAEPRLPSDGSVRDHLRCKLDRRIRKHRVTHRPFQFDICQSRSCIIAVWLWLTMSCGAATPNRGLRTAAAPEHRMRGSMTDRSRLTFTTSSRALVADTNASLSACPVAASRVVSPCCAASTEL